MHCQKGAILLTVDLNEFEHGREMGVPNATENPNGKRIFRVPSSSLFRNCNVAIIQDPMKILAGIATPLPDAGMDLITPRQTRDNPR